MQNKANFKILDTKTAYKSEKVQVDRCKVALPNGNVVTWDINVLPNMFFGIPLKDGYVYMTKEWRLGPNKILTQFTGARCFSTDYEENLKELKRELHEELGIAGGKYQKLVSFQNGIRTTGIRTYFIVTDFGLEKPKRNENEIQETNKLPVKGLFDTLIREHEVTADTLLAAKMIEKKS